MNFGISFSDPLGGGAIVLLALLLLLSTAIGIRHAARVKTPSQYLIADFRASWYDFAASQVAYVMGVATTVVVYPALAYAYGPIIIPFVCIAWIVSLVVFGFFIRNTKLREFLKKDYGIQNFLHGTRFQSGLVSFIIALTYWGLFGLELVAVMRIFNGIFPSSSRISILILAFVLAVVYTVLGGYLSTMRTDFFQTLFFMVVGCIIAFAILPQQFASQYHVANIFSGQLFQTNPNTSPFDLVVISVSIMLAGVGYLFTGQDVWSRSSATSRKIRLRNTYIGLAISVIAIIPFVAIFEMGLYMFAINPNLDPSQYEIIPSLLIKMMAKVAPIGLFIPTVISIAISTADTALITSVQAFRGFRWATKLLNTLTGWRILTLGLGSLGLLMAFIFPDVISGVFALSGVPLAFAPLVVARMCGMRVKVWVGNFILLASLILALVAGVMGGDTAKAAPLAVLVFASVLYPALHLLPIGARQNEG